MKNFLFVKYFKESLVVNNWVPMLQSFVLVLFILFFVSMVIWVVTKPKYFYKEHSENPLKEDSNFLN
ncbi:MAG: cbb3-type cytochrome c oxidase subunit 3 [Solirubrobacteraceae bacterium]